MRWTVLCLGLVLSVAGCSRFSGHSANGDTSASLGTVPGNPGQPIVTPTPAPVTASPGTGQAGAPLPSGYLSVSGNQIVSSTGVNVRLSCVGYDEPTGNFLSDMSKIRAAGFNCVRYSWITAAVCPGGNCTFTSGQGKTMDAIVSAAAANNMKVIFSHHANENDGTRCSWQQENGLWYDVNDNTVDPQTGVAWNSLTGNYNGCGTPGTVTYSRFRLNSVQVAKHYAGNSTVIAFDLWNEPLVGTPVACGAGCQAVGKYLNWGGNNGSDLHLMCSDVGTAVEAADPGVLIICEGAINFTGKYLSGAAYPTGANGIADLSKAGALPVNVGAPKVVYSIHDYPGWLSGQKPDSGAASVTFRNQAWGYLVMNNTAPVWIGEGGASMDGTDGQSADDTAWATSLMQYVNGQAVGGPTFTGTQQPIGFDWWYFGYGPGQQMDGIYSNSALTSYNLSQQAYWTTLLYTPR